MCDEDEDGVGKIMQLQEGNVVPEEEQDVQDRLNSADTQRRKPSSNEDDPKTKVNYISLMKIVWYKVLFFISKCFSQSENNLKEYFTC